jgi:hypothetical protein
MKKITFFYFFCAVTVFFFSPITAIGGGMPMGSPAPFPKEDVAFSEPDPSSDIGKFKDSPGYLGGDMKERDNIASYAMDVKIALTTIAPTDSKGFYCWGGEKPSCIPISGGVLFTDEKTGEKKLVFDWGKGKGRRVLTLFWDGDVLKGKYQMGAGYFCDIKVLNRIERP